MAVGDEVVDHEADGADGQGEAQALHRGLGAVGGAHFQGIDADDLAILVDQGTAGVAGVDGVDGVEGVDGVDGVEGVDG